VCLLASTIGIALLETLAEIRERDTILRPSRSGERRDDLVKVDLDHFVVERIVSARSPESLGLRIRLHQRDVRVVATGDAEVVEGDPVDREEGGRGTELWRHVRDRGSIREGDGRETVAERLDIGTDDTVRAQSFGDGEHQVCRGRAGGEFPGQSEAHDLREWREERFAEQHRLSLDPANTETEDPKAGDHGGVRVGADTRIRKCEWSSVDLLDAHNGRKALEVNLVHDAGARGYDTELVECALGPSQQLIPLGVSLVLLCHVLLEGLSGGPSVDLDRVIDHEVGGHLRVDALRIDVELARCVTQRGKVDDSRDAGKVLQHDACGREGELTFFAGCRCGRARFPCEIGVDIFLPHKAIPCPSRRPFEEDLEDEREARQRCCRSGEPLDRDPVREARAEAHAHGGSIDHAPSSCYRPHCGRGKRTALPHHTPLREGLPLTQ